MGRYARLHSLLWEKETVLRDVVFVKKPVSVPEFAENKSCSTTVVEHNVLSLDGAIDVYLGDKPSENTLDWMKLLLSQRWHVPVTGGGLGWVLFVRGRWGKP